MANMDALGLHNTEVGVQILQETVACCTMVTKSTQFRDPAMCLDMRAHRTTVHAEKAHKPQVLALVPTQQHYLIRANRTEKAGDLHRKASKYVSHAVLTIKPHPMIFTAMWTPNILWNITQQLDTLSSRLTTNSTLTVFLTSLDLN